MLSVGTDYLQTDDVGVFCSLLSQEYYLAAQHFALSRDDVRALCEGAIRSIFGGPHEEARLRKLYDEWSGWIS
jgi:adenosine deaminase